MNGDGNLFGIITEVAEELLLNDDSNIIESLDKAIYSIVRDRDIRRVTIWENRSIDGLDCYQKTYTWLKDGELIGGNQTERIYHGMMPDWKTALVGGRIISGSLEDFSEMERGFLEQFDIKSILVTPIHIRDKYWGFISYDSGFSEIKFTETDIQFMKLLSTLLVNAYFRSLIMKENLEALEQVKIATTLAETDKLTKLWNRDTFSKNVDLYYMGNADEQTEDAFYMFDVDHFKEVNDTYGHITGDKVLEQVGSLLRNAVRSSDFVGRQGGDEFVLFLKSINPEVAERKAKQICEGCHSIILDEEKGIHLTASLGVSLSPKDGKSFQELYKSADAALYIAKESGRNRYCFT